MKLTETRDKFLKFVILLDELALLGGLLDPRHNLDHAVEVGSALEGNGSQP